MENKKEEEVVEIKEECNTVKDEIVNVVEEKTIDEIQEIVKEDEVVEPQEILSEEVFVEEVVVEEQKIPKLNNEYCQEMGLNQKVINRFWKKIKLPDNLIDGCWNWTTYKDKKGYGEFSFAGSTYGAHRFSYMIFKGEILDGKLICHKCNNTSCVNPYHLYSGTHYDNTQDMLNSNRGNSNKISEYDVKNMLLRLWDGGITFENLSVIYNISVSAIWKIVNRKTWKRIFDQLSVEQKQKIRYNIKHISVMNTNMDISISKPDNISVKLHKENEERRKQLLEVDNARHKLRFMKHELKKIKTIGKLTDQEIENEYFRIKRFNIV